MIKWFPAWENVKQPTCSFATMGLLPWEQMQMTKRKEHFAFSLKHSTNTVSIHIHMHTCCMGEGNTENIHTIQYALHLSLRGKTASVVF